MTAFLNRYARAFGGSPAMLLRLSGLDAAEIEAKGAWVTDAAGRQWLDFGSFGVHLLGHRHPAIVTAARHQLGHMALSTKILGNDAAATCAESLLRHTPPSVDRVLFANSGGECVDAAVRIAMLATGRSELASLRGAYHGRTAGALALSEPVVTGLRTAPAYAVHRLESGDVEGAERVLMSRRVAALFAEPVQGEGGIRPLPGEFLAALHQLCKKTGTLLVLDEIQTGLGRCGKLWRSAADCEPDILLTGKTLGGGLLPLAATIYSSDRIGSRETDPLLMASTFAGGALAGRVGDAVLEVISRERFLVEVLELGEEARTGLTQALAERDEIVEVRGEGLMIGVRCKTPAFAGDLVMEALKRQLLVTFCINELSVIRVYPPAVVDTPTLWSGIERLADAADAASRNAQRERGAKSV
ncbi:MAG TPA: aspartate aminotransferase family protein [Solirubrobacterales bacterium]|jgi:acetylornithine aminotransferase/putrescine aminotransferase